MEENERLMSSTEVVGDEEESIRPGSLDEYIGQDSLKENLRIYIQAALQRNESLDHVLLYGPPGLGKTTLSYILSHEMHTNIKIITGPSISKPGDLASVLSTLDAGDILFIDEIHRLPKVVEEVLYPAMEDFEMDVMVGGENGQGGRSVRLPLPPFTLVGATTRAGDLSSPLRDRFGIISKLEYYNEAQLSAIIARSSRVLSVSIDAKKDDWTKALKEEQMLWMQGWTPDSGKSVLKTYQFNGIPFIILIDKEGKIYRKHLRGEQIKKAIDDCLMGKKFDEK